MVAVVETGRLILRGMEREDFPALAAIWQEPDVVRHIGGAQRSLAESWGVFLRIAGSWAIEGFGQWGIFRKTDGAFLGQAGFFTAMRGLGPDFDGVPEAGYALTARVHGQGYGREAVAAAHGWFDAQTFGGRSRAMIEPGAGPSLAIARRLGYRQLRTMDFEGAAVLLFARDLR